MIDVLAKPGSVSKGASKLTFVSPEDLGKKEGWFYDEANHEVLVSFPDSPSEIVVSIQQSL